MAIQAIPTRWNGYMMRSRLEARWAIVLEELGIDYRYESQGYRTTAGLFLPDFDLIGLGYFLEIKPNREAAGRGLQRPGH